VNFSVGAGFRQPHFAGPAQDLPHVLMVIRTGG
jgi:hypothetical protein